jgi:stage III sporulation protein SpoIIIAA
LHAIETQRFRFDFSTLLASLTNENYVRLLASDSQGLKWNVPRVIQAAYRMPEYLKLQVRCSSRSHSEESVERPTETLHPSETEAPSVVLQREKRFELADSTECYVIEDLEALICMMAHDPVFDDTSEQHIAAISCKVSPEELQFIQLATDRAVYIIDCQVIGQETVCDKLEPLFSSEGTIKAMHDLHDDAVALHRRGSVSLSGVLDTQLFAESSWGEVFLGLHDMLSRLEVWPNGHKESSAHTRIGRSADLWRKRPIPGHHLERIARDVHLLLKSVQSIQEPYEDKSDMKCLIHASTLRARNAVTNDNGMISICFDIQNDYTLASAELIQTFRPNQGFMGEPLLVESDLAEDISVLPSKFLAKLGASRMLIEGDSSLSTMREKLLTTPKEEELPLDRLSDIVLDTGRRPHCWIEHQRVFLSDDTNNLVNKDDIEGVAERPGDFGLDNRAGLNGKLHRFSAMRDRKNSITGITIRVGRHVYGNAGMLMDILLGSNKSILILGEPGSGKTTIVREATRKLAEQNNVIVVDTSNEIAGDGMIPHACIGFARRMMVPSLDRQSAIMVECVQNHTPHVMVIDEIGRSSEVQAARTVKQRGVRVIASAHGDFRRLVKNKDLVGLVGGIEHVTMGDAMAKQEAKRKQHLASSHDIKNRAFQVSKTKAERGGEPTFEVIVEVQRRARHEWKVITDSAKAVDSILDGLNYKAQLRIRDPETGALKMELSDW